MCKYCVNGECELRDGIADDCSCRGDISEMVECVYGEDYIVIVSKRNLDSKRRYLAEWTADGYGHSDWFPTKKDVREYFTWANIVWKEA